jgi:glycosyltransferase involved in cell wall biosynthesis
MLLPATTWRGRTEINTTEAVMRIAQVSPLYESVPPKLYGGTERVVSHLTEELVRIGHEVTLFASGDSVTSAKLVSGCPRALRLDKRCVDPMAPHFVMMEEVFRRAADFDLIHFHIDYLHFPLSRRLSLPSVTTLHGRLDIADLQPLYREYCSMPLVSISNAQRRPLPWCNWVGTVYHGLPLDLHALRPRSGDYLAFLGRISPEKGCDRAIEIARRAGMPIKIAAKIDNADRAYYERVVKPLFDQPHVEFIGEINDSQKQDFLGNARAVLFPIDWPEPFGLVMIEAISVGTPVIAFSCGSVPEIMIDGKTGFVVNDIDEAVEAVEKVGRLDRAECRAIFEERFSSRRMAHDYLKVYAQIIDGNSRGGRSHPGQRPVLHPRHLPASG